ncbi:MAG: zinc-ribbon domain-containing protein [Fibromonadales bacterium]|nr:zinc-ribbon domain-containing protein [Fibromonadales bacterium]
MKAIFCLNCGNKLEDNFNFCPQCGTKVASNALSTPSDSSGTLAKPNDTVGIFTDPRDGKVYKTVKIGNQVWMAENLAYDAPGSKCYKSDPANFKKYGLLYDWGTAMKVCPSGWHLPSQEEWQTLVDFVGGDEIAGKKLKAINGWQSNEGKPGGGTDNFGFAALPGGRGLSGGSFLGVGGNGNWWSASEYVAGSAYGRHMGYVNENVTWDYYDKDVLHSIRCLQD